MKLNVKFRAEHYEYYRRQFLFWYLLSLIACAACVYGLWVESDKVKSALIQAPILIWFATFTFTFYMMYHTEQSARFISNFGRYFLIQTPEIGRDHKYTYYIQGPHHRAIIMTECVNMKEITIVSSQYTPIFPKLFYTHLIRDLKEFGTRAEIELTDTDKVRIKEIIED